jgi:hypothetical protein
MTYRRAARGIAGREQRRLLGNFRNPRQLRNQEMQSFAIGNQEHELKVKTLPKAFDKS